MAGPSTALILSDGSAHPIEGDVVIGRDADAAVSLDDATVSRRHAIVAARNGRWYVADTGSLNGTLLNGERVPPGVALQLRHGDRLQIGVQTILFSCPEERDDPLRTLPADMPAAPASAPPSEFQRRVLECLCTDWLADSTLDRMPSNREIAERLGTPDSEGAVKSALRRAYAKAGLTDGSAHEKRRRLCRIARQNGWI